MKKKILIIHHSGLMGGAGVSLYNMWSTLKLKYDVTIYIPDSPSELYEFLVEKKLIPKTFPFRLGKITYYSGGNNLHNLKFWYHALHSFTQISYWNQIVKDEKPDLIIVNSKVLCWMGIMFQKLNVKCACIVRETIKGNPKNLMNKILAYLLNKFSFVTFLSKYDINQTNLDKAQAILAPDYLNVQEYEDSFGRMESCKFLGLEPNTFNVLFVGGVNTLKGIDVAIKAMNIVKNENITLIVAGNGLVINKNAFSTGIINRVKNRNIIKFSSKLNRFIKSNQLQERIKFIGIQKNMNIVYSASDILIFPMKSPHQARPAFEIGVQRKPVIISNFPHIHEYVENRFNGITFEPGNYDELAFSILELYQNLKLITELGNNNYKWTIKYHTEDNAMRNLISKIDTLI